MSPSRPRRTWPQRFVLLANLMLVTLCLGAAAGLEYLSRKVESVEVFDFGKAGGLDSDPVLTPVEEPDQPINFLLVGTDSAEGLDEDDPRAADREGIGERADTVMIVRFDPIDKDVRLLSIPRDLWVDISGVTYRSRINTALSISPATLIETVEDQLGIPINHYVQVDFAGFEELVDILGGVPMWFDTPVRDTQTGLIVEETGCVTLDPEQALAYARSRTFQREVDGRWRAPDPSADLGRISRQQDFIRRAGERAVDRGFRNLVDLNRILNAGINAVTIDDDLTVGDLLALGRAFRTFEPTDLDTYQLPTRFGRVGQASVLFLVEAEAEEVLRRFRPELDAGELAPEDIRVRALNGTGGLSEASDVAEGLERAGFDTVGRDNAETFDNPRTVIRYRRGAEVEAALVARFFEPTPRFEADDAMAGADVAVITGEDFDGVLERPRPAAEINGPEPTDRPSSTGSDTSVETETSVVDDEDDDSDEDEQDTANAEDTGESGDDESSASTTTVPGDVPEAPTGSAC